MLHDGTQERVQVRLSLGFLLPNGWQCHRCFRQSDQAYAPVEVPPNAYVDGSSQDWHANAAFARRIASRVTTGIATGRFCAKETFA